MYWTRYRTFVLAAVLAASAFALLRGAAPQVPTGTWSAAGALSSVRAGSASALLPNATLLVTGGEGADGALPTAEVLGWSGTFSPAASMSVARSDHAAVALDEGRVLVVGGHNAQGAVASAETYSAGEWSPVGDLTDARWGHTATLLADGRVLIAGGENAAGVLTSVELFNPDTETFSIVGTLSSPRKGHAAARLADGRVLIAGGFSGDAALSSIDVFDPETESVGPLGVSLGTPRAGLSATTLLDGKVLFFGGNDGSNDLATSEIFDAATGAIVAGPAATAARRDHDAFLLPNNNAVLIVGGATADGASASAELYLSWLNQFWSTAPPAAPRYRAAGSALSTESYGEAPAGAGVLVLAGGVGQNSSEAYGFATISVDKDDYSPGETVHVSGRGWQPGDVTFELREVVPEHTPRLFTLTADEHGVIPMQELFLVEPHHLGVRFYLTARDAASQAQITFTDGNATSISGTVVSSAAGNPAIAGATIVCSAGCNNSPAATATSNAAGAYVFDNTTTKLSFNTNGPINLQLTASKTGFVSQTITLNNVSNGATITAANFSLLPSIATTALAASSATGTYGGSVTLVATLTSNGSGVSGKSVSFALNGTSVGTAITNAVGTATLNSVSLSGTNAGTYTGGVAVSFAGDSAFAASSGSANLTVNPLPVNLTGTRVYDGTATAAANILFVSNAVGSDTVTVTAGSATLASEGVGARAITSVGTLALGDNGAGNYTLTGATGAVTITARAVTFKADDVTRVYGESTPAFSYSISSGSIVNGDELGTPTFSAPGGTVGTHTITLSGLENPNYAVTFVTGTLTVTPRPITVTADAQTKVYGENDPALTYKITAGALVNGDSFSGNLSRVGGEDVGAYAIQQGSLALNSNYALTYVAATLTITPRPITVTADTQSKTYGGADPTLTYQTTSGTLVNGDAFSGALTRAPGENAGTYAILQGSLTAGNNYALTFVGALLTINKAPLIVTATAVPATLAYPAVPAIGVTFAGFVNNETSTVLGGTLVQTVLAGNTAVATAPLTGAFPPGQYTVQPSGLIAQNYAITYCPAAFIITNAAPVIVSVTGPAPIAIGTAGIASATLNVSFTDPGVTSDTFIVGSQWTAANGATPSSISSNVVSYGGLNGAATISASGLVPGVYTVLVTVTDQFAATSSPYEYHYVVIYDPAGGFVTGGGWFDSPAGACQTGIVNNVCTGSPTGKANFGFVAKYLKGQQKPDGNTEFQFQAGNLSFKSTDYEWLVISGTTQAQFKGSGTINGSGTFGFMLTAVDGDNFGNKKPDAFRVKIWDTVSGSTVYDNQLGRDESSLTDATVLGGGSIVIHGK